MGHKSQFENWLSGAVNLISWIMNVMTALPGKRGNGGSGDKCLSDDKYCKMRNLIFQVILKVGKIKKKKWNLVFLFPLVAFMSTH